MAQVDALTPLQFGCRRAVLVGDPQQLPATVLSQAAAASNFQRSLYERLQVQPHFFYKYFILIFVTFC